MVLASARVLACSFNGDVDLIDPGDLGALLSEVNENNWASKAEELAQLSHWFKEIKTQ